MNKGISQELRYNKALETDFIPIDERSMLDLVQFTLTYAEQIQYYNFSNEPDGDWRPFFLNDSAFIIALIAGTDLARYKTENDEIVFEYGDADHQGKVVLIAKSVDNILNMSHHIVHWSELLFNSGFSGSLSDELRQLVDSIRKHLAYIEKLIEKLKNNRHEGELLNQILDTYGKIIAHLGSPSLYDADSDAHSYSEEEGEGVGLPTDESLNETFAKFYRSIFYIKEKFTKQFEEEVESSGNHQPHIGLLLAFFKLFRTVQEDLNGYIREHLDYYYKMLLRQVRKENITNSAFVALEPTEGRDLAEIEEGEEIEVQFKGKKIIPFKTNARYQVNRARVSEVRTIFKGTRTLFNEDSDDSDYNISVLYEQLVYSANDEIPVSKDPPAVLGEDPQGRDALYEQVNLSDVGFMVTSPVLVLEDGKREIHLKIHVDSHSTRFASSFFDRLLLLDRDLSNENAPIDKEVWRERKKGAISKFFRDAFRIYITGYEGWEYIRFYKIRIYERVTFDFTLTLEQGEHLIAPYQKEVHGGNYDTNWPCIKILLNNQAVYHPYRYLKSFIVESVTIEANVEGATNLNLSNSVGELDTSIPFTPFGPLPSLGSYLQIRNPLIFHRYLSDLRLSMYWNGLPQQQSGFADQYMDYPYNIDNTSFIATISKFKNYHLTPADEKRQHIPLFNTSMRRDGEFLNDEIVNEIDPNKLNFAESIKSEYSKQDPALVISLKSPDIAFGHQVFPELYANAALKNSRARNKDLGLPNQPYTPVLDRLVVTYTNKASELLHRKSEVEDASIQLFHINPFGHTRVYPGPAKSVKMLLPQIDDTGSLFIGLEDVKAGDIVNIGFDLIPAVFLHSAIKAPSIYWSFLINNEWAQLPQSILEDGTENLIRSGVVKIKMPGNVQYDTTRLPSDKFWIKAATRDHANLNSRIKSIVAQAVPVTAKESVTAVIDEELKQMDTEKITLDPKLDIGSAQGPFALEFTTKGDNEDFYYSSVSELLRHKSRAITHWDFERLILDKFPQIKKVRVYGRSSRPSELVKGSSVQIVLLPKPDPSTVEMGTDIKVSKYLLQEITSYLQQFISPFVKVEVSNPVFEKLKVRCKVKFTDNKKAGYYRNVLNRELVQYLSPDSDNYNIDKGFDESISKTEILRFIESRSYVEFVTEFSILQLVEVQNKHRIIDTAEITKIESLRTISAYAILTSVKQHKIEVIQDSDAMAPREAGIGDIAVSADFIISNEDD